MLKKPAQRNLKAPKASSLEPLQYHHCAQFSVRNASFTPRSERKRKGFQDFGTAREQADKLRHRPRYKLHETRFGDDFDMKVEHAHRRPSSKPKVKEFVLKGDSLPTRELSMELGVAKERIFSLLRMPLDTKSSKVLTQDQIEEVCIMLDVDFKLYSEVFNNPQPYHVSHPGAEIPPHAPPRSPVVTIMGHVDHGKTTLLDALRNTDVAANEAGGITQHIGAFQVRISDQEAPVTFIDTPGHAAFSAMRRTGANVTDIVVLVVAADDGIKPQTIEAIKHAQDAGVPIIVAINKMDMPNSKPKRVKEQLLRHNIRCTDFNGDIEVVEISALKRQGLEQLIEVINFQAELLDLRAEDDCGVEATVIESRVEKGLGITSTVVVKRGTLVPEQWVVCNKTYGRIKLLRDHLGNAVDEARPATPVALVGLKDLPNPGDYILEVESEERAKDVVEFRMMEERRKKEKAQKALNAAADQSAKPLNIILKADVQGSIDALRKVLARFPKDRVSINILHEGVGNINDGDIDLASTFGGEIFGLNIKGSSKELNKASKLGVRVFTTPIIYKLVDELKRHIEDMFEPIEVESPMGKAKVLSQFEVTFKKDVQIALGCSVNNGAISRHHTGLRIIRDGKEIGRGTIQSLRHFKKDVNEVKTGNECGIVVSFDHNSPIDAKDVREGDIVESFERRKTKQKFEEVYTNFQD